MNISSNQFTKKVFNKLTGFTDKTLPTLIGLSDKTFLTGENAWGGDNTGGSVYGVDDLFGGPDSTYGENPYGLTHFKLRTQGSISH